MNSTPSPWIRTLPKACTALAGAWLLTSLSGCALYPSAGAGSVHTSLGVGRAGHGVGVSYHVPVQWSALSVQSASLPPVSRVHPAAGRAAYTVADPATDAAAHAVHPAYATAALDPWGSTQANAVPPASSAEGFAPLHERLPDAAPHTPQAVWVGAAQQAQRKQALAPLQLMPHAERVHAPSRVHSNTEGQVVDIRPVTYRAHPQASAAVGSAVGGVLGGVLANNNSHRYHRSGNTVAGVLVGALIGSALGSASSYAGQTTAYRVTARMDSGLVRHIDYVHPPSVRIGERVAFDGHQFYR